MNDEKPIAAKRWLKNRRSQRIELSVPVVVYRAPEDGPQFYEHTETLVVSAHGALIALTDLVVPRQKLLVQNPSSGEHLECRVVSVKRPQIGPPQVALEFVRPTPSFWHIAFPPADWKATI
ncbi:MAG TPA: PilZ domain-containing protein [Candidatus Eremiobacteraceae bacterium]|nr:PilZ domain-containing protein [Candidatus Eremiobacteraceae bacterium]